MNIIDYTNKGKRNINQDFLLHMVLPDQSAICVLADGMGGYSHGEFASKLVSEHIAQYIQNNIAKQEPLDLLRNSIIQSNEDLMLAKLEMGIKRMGAVIAVLLIKDDKAYFSWLGDARIYMFRNDVEVYRTVDHSLLNEIIDSTQDKNSLDALSIERFSSMVTKAVMGEENLGDIPVKFVKIHSDDMFILCTDGFHKELGVNMVKSFSQDQKDRLDMYSTSVNDNYSFIKVLI